MPKTLPNRIENIAPEAENRNRKAFRLAYQHEPNRRKSDYSKEMFQEVGRLSSRKTIQENWPRVVRKNSADIETTDSDILMFLLPEHEPDVDEPIAIDPDEIVEFFSTGGKASVLKIVRAFRDRAAHRESFQTLIDVLREVMRFEQIDHLEVDPSKQPARETFLNRAQRLDSQGRTDVALDLVYDTIDEMLQISEFSKVDLLLDSIEPDELSVDILLGILTATLPARSRLASRVKFLVRVEASLKRRGELEDGLLTGL